jgi:hypothetical protein
MAEIPAEPTRDGTADRTADRMAILQLEAEYARTWDTGDPDGWAGCFTADGAFEIGSTSAFGAWRAAGRAELAAFARRGTERYEGIHLLSPPALDFEPPGSHPPGSEGGAPDARGWVHFQYFDRHRTRGTRRHVVGLYAVRYARTAEGWRMALRREQAVRVDDEWFGFPPPERMWATELT